MKKSVESSNNLPYLKGHMSPQNRNLQHESVKSTARIDTAFAVNSANNEDQKKEKNSPSRVL